MKKKKVFMIVTVAQVFDFFRGYLSFIGQHYDVCAISSDKEELEKIGHEEGIRTQYIFMRRSISLWSDCIGLLKFILLFLKEKPDLIHSSSPKGSLLSMVAGKLTGLNTRIYMCIGLRYEGSVGLKRHLLMLMERLTCSCATEVICVSNGVKQNLIQNGLCPDFKTLILGYGGVTGIDLDHFKPEPRDRMLIRKELKIPEDAFVFLFVGRMVRDKGIDELIHCFKDISVEYESTYLIFVGAEEGKANPLRPHTIKWIRDSDKVVSVGQQTDVRPYLTAADTLVHPTYREGFGMVLVEAGAMGLPCITTDVSGCNEIVEDGKNGLIVPPKDHWRLAEAMKRILNEEDLLERLKENSREMVATRYEQSVMWSRLRGRYETLLKRKGQM